MDRNLHFWPNLKCSWASKVLSLKKIIQTSKSIQSTAEWYIALNSLGPRDSAFGKEIRAAQSQLIREGFAQLGPDTDLIRKNPAWVETDFADFRRVQ